MNTCGYPVPIIYRLVNNLYTRGIVVKHLSQANRATELVKLLKQYNLKQAVY